MSGRRGSCALLAAVLAFLAAFLVWPMLDVVRRAVTDREGFTLLYLRNLLTEPLQLEALGNSLIIALCTTAAALAVALPLAWAVARRSFPGRTLLSGLLLAPLILPPFVGAVGMKIVLARSGALSTLLMRAGLARGPVDWLGAYPLLGVVLMETLHLFPIMYLNLVAAFANIDPSLEEAAVNLGAARGRVFRRVTLPLAGPGLFGGTVLVFVWSFTELGTPLVFGFRRVLPVMIYDGVSEAGTNPAGYAQVLFVIAVAALGFLISKRITGRRRDVATLGRLSVARREPRLSAAGLALLAPFATLLLALAVLPHASVALVAVGRRWFLTALPEGFTLEFFARAVGSDLTRTALLNSLGLALGAAALDAALGFGIAWLCVRRRIAGADLIDTLAMAPLAIPGLVIAFGYLGCFAGRFPGTLLDPRFNPLLLLTISYAVRRLPYMLRAAHAGLEQTSRAYEEAAANLGASPWRVVRRVTFPLIAANLLAGGILCFAFAMLEVSDSLILAQTEAFYPITKAIYVLMEGLENGVNVAAALGVWAMALLAAAMLWAAALLGKRMGQMFRAG
ncbi:MAG: iron ABC transporter permease [Lentisphaerae bacterium]|nr:iron ABC transporter permease [Lentisphaerota bacterium]